MAIMIQEDWKIIFQSLWVLEEDWKMIFQSSWGPQKDWKMIFQSSWIMMVIRISIENRGADHSNQPNPKSYAPRKLASDKEISVIQVKLGR